ncbi:MAG: RNA pseudouridine synthase, partial [Oscillospiraceae bacterium]|nr:RNA pseudouridine synthase [Oscillospiraceae bacterium]
YSAREGKRAITDYEVISERAGFSFVRVRLQTGRKNQIRVHMKELGNPVVGDKKYGSSSNPVGRLGLHASALGFVHPVTGKEIVIKASAERKFALPKK